MRAGKMFGFLTLLGSTVYTLLEYGWIAVNLENLLQCEDDHDTTELK